ncbi:unnamed protein product [Trichogramma brassicae]|uniref:HTH psq-type domain-containing protein n=1 Tax=Trichogramma brassicae TaxID=86971 RepID=A0A6H5J6U1_9HYME|nr:unnamed protein product [Trichogramma brassicae]
MDSNGPAQEGDNKVPGVPSSQNKYSIAVNTMLAARKRRMHQHFDDFVQCYFDSRAKDVTFGSNLPEYESNNATGLDSFRDDLVKFSRYNSLKPLATLNYSSDIFYHSTIVSSIEFDKDNEFFAIAGVTKRIKVFDYNTVVQGNVDLHYPCIEMTSSSKISCVSWNSFHKSTLASSDYEGTVSIWDSVTGQKTKAYHEHEKRCWSIDFNDVDTRLIASGSDDARVKLWSLNMDHSVASLEAKANVCCVKFNPESSCHLAFGSADHCVHYYDLRNMKEPLSLFKGHKKAVSYVKFVNKNELVSASTDSQLKMWNIKNPNCLRSLVGHVNEKNFVGLATDGDYVACGSENNALYVYYKGLSKQLFSYKFFAAKSILEVQERREDDLNEFVSAVCWKQSSNVVVAANSQAISNSVKLPEEVDRLLRVASTNCSGTEDYPGQRIIEKVAASGYVDIIASSIECDEPATLHRTTPVHHAAKTRFSNWQLAARQLLKIYGNFRVNYIAEESGLTHMHVACMCGVVDIVEECLNLGHDVDRRVTETGDSLVHLSVEHSQAEMFAFLLRRGIDINATNRQGSTPLHLLGQRIYDDDFAEIFFRLIDDDDSQKVQIDLQDENGNTALHAAVDHKHQRLMKLLLRRGADTNIANAKGETFLHVLCWQHIDNDISELLFEIADEKNRPVLIDAQDEKGNAPLHLALEGGSKVTAELLLKRGADLDLKNNDGSTALHVICKRAMYWEDGLPEWFFKINQNLLRTIRVDARDNFGKTPLELALSDGNETLVRLLLKNGADVNLANCDGSVPLHLASAKEGDYKNLLEVIFELGKEKNQLVQVDARDKKGRTPLHRALTSECKIESVRLLLDNGADISAVDDEGLTPLHYISEPLDLSVHEKIPYVSNDNKLVIDRAAIGDRQSELNFNYSLGISSTQTTQISTAQSSSSEREINKRTYKNYSPEQLLLAIKTVAEQKMSPTAAAEANGIPSRTLYDKLTKYGIPTPKKRKSDKVSKPISSRGKNP